MTHLANDDVSEHSIQGTASEEVFVFPTSFAQQRLWFLNRLNPKSVVYNIVKGLRLTGPLDSRALELSINEIVRRHETLRTTFAIQNGEPVQVIRPAATLELPLIDLSNLSADRYASEIKRLIAEHVNYVFDLVHGPLIRAILIKRSSEEHIFLLSMHHIISDGWSISIFYDELSKFYQYFAYGTRQPIADLPIQYADYAVWQREKLKDQLEDHIKYWKQQLGANLPMIDLPLDHPRPPFQTERGARIFFQLSPTLSASLDAMSRREGVTLFMTLLAAFQVLLARYTHQEDIVVGSPIANRNRVELEGLIGFFVNTLVLRTSLAGNPSFRELLHRVREVALGAYAHQEMPFDRLVAELNPVRDPSRSPLFQVMFVLQNAPGRALAVPGWQVESVPVETETAMFDLTLELTETEQGLRGVVEYNTDLFEGATIERLVGHYREVLAGVVADASPGVWAVPLLTAGERHQLLVEWNQTERAYPRERGVHQLFEDQVARTPDAIAVTGRSLQSHREEVLTYRELNQRANQLAHYLRQMGVGPEVRVGVSLHRTIEMPVAVLGILKAGGTYVPLDPAFPTERLEYMIDDAGLALVITEESLAMLLPDHCTRIVWLGSDWVKIQEASAENLNSGVTSEKAAYILYTSGSTGKPKGVPVLHRGLTNFLTSMQQTPGLAQDDVLLAVTTLSFDIAGLELYLPLITGARVVIAEREVAAEGARLAQKISACGATVMQATPATWRMLLDAGWQGNPRMKILCGGEVLPRELADQLLDRCGSLWNLYGPTETTIWSTVQRVERTKPITIGRPIANTTIYILDAHLQPVPIGVPGDLYIGGEGVARGYLNRPELTAARFIRDPFANDPNARMYMTGDVARYLPDGQIDYLGRSDDQVKVRGFRIELGEIESALCQHPGIHQAVVVAHEFQAGDKRLVAYVLPASAAMPSSGELRTFLRERLPDYMVPSLFMPVAQFPLTPNGKIDRRALPRPDQNPIEPRARILPRNDLEKRLAAIWEQVLNVRPIGVQDDFFDLGGHSLLGVKLFAQIEKVFGKRLALGTLFQASTIEQLAQILPQPDNVLGSSLVTIQPKGTHPPFYCVHEYDGNVLYYRDLAARMGEDYPFIGLQAQGLNGKQMPLESFEEIAAHYIKEIQAFQPNGPYFLGGSSLGGMVAFEMAQQLVAQGQRVALLALFDTWSPGYLKLLKLPLPQVVSRHTEALSRLTLGEQIAYVCERARSRLNLSDWLMKHYNRLRWQTKKSVCRLYVALGRPLPTPLANFYTGEKMVQALNKYVPKPYPGRVTFFLAQNRPRTYYHDPGLSKDSLIAAGFCSSKNVDAVWAQVYPLGWGALAQGGLDVIQVPGTHAFIVREPYAKFLATELRRCIDQAGLE
jgi:aspartate racemase